MKKTIFKKINKMYRIVLLLIVFVMLVSLIPAGAVTVSTGNLKRIQLSSGKTVTLTKQQLDDVVEITADEAEEIARLFVADMIKIGNVCWNENTEVVTIVPMYDNTDTNTVTAYTVNLSKGYIVVSGFSDTRNIIPEWSDESEPLYKSIESSIYDKIIYLGLYEYYIDSGDNKAKGLGNISVEKEKIPDNISHMRSIDYIPETVLESVAKNNAASTNSSDDKDPPIANPITHGNQYYTGPFVMEEGIDYWSNFVTYYTGDYAYDSFGYNDCCGPVAFTNLVGAYKARYAWAGNDLLKGYNNTNALFYDIMTYGINQGYYLPGRGTNNRINYISDLMNMYSIWSNYYSHPEGIGVRNYENLYNLLISNRLIDIALGPHHIHGYHEILCHGVTRLRSTTNNAYLSYMHIADGWNTSIRYITVASAMTSEAVSLQFLWV